MDKEQLIRTCRYYRGEKECPSDNENIQTFWNWERVYVESNGKFDGESDYYNYDG